MPITVALAGDTMLGRGVAEQLAEVPTTSLVAPEVAEAAAEADLFVLNLECCISERGQPWPDPDKPFFFRAPPEAVDLLVHLGVDCVTVANNHALDFGAEALEDTVEHLRTAGIEAVGAGPNEDTARRPVILEQNGFRLGVVAAADHPADFAAGPHRPGIAYADLRRGLPEWVRSAVADVDADAILFSPHWGPNMAAEPVSHVRDAAAELRATPVTLIAGHSAHVFQGVSRGVIYDLGDFLDDYAVDPVLRNDLGLLFLVTIDGDGPVRLEAVPLKLDYCFTRLADGDDQAWITDRFRQACGAMGTEVIDEDGRLVVRWR